MIKLKELLKEIEDENDDGQIDFDRLHWSESYLDDVLERLGYNIDFNKNFWIHPHTLYHCTPDEHVPAIEQNGLRPSSKTRGISNRGVGAAVFTTMHYEEVDSLRMSYGDNVFMIDTKAMKQDGYMPEVSLEPEWEQAKKLEFIYHKLGKEDMEASRFVDSSDGVSEGTVIVHGAIPAKYLKRLQ
jgi:hypothetical protein